MVHAIKQHATAKSALDAAGSTEYGNDVKATYAAV